MQFTGRPVASAADVGGGNWLTALGSEAAIPFSCRRGLAQLIWPCLALQLLLLHNPSDTV
jgi:hypothetical protein